MNVTKILPREIFEKIIDQFSGGEIKNFMLVDKSWYETIASSTYLMKEKFRLCIQGDWMDNDDLEEIVASKRSYHNILISNGNEIHNPICKILSNPRHHWKQVEIYDQSIDELVESIGAFESSVKKLTLNKIHVTKMELLELNFKNLEELKISYCDTKFLKCSPKLKSLELGDMNMKREDDEDVLETLRKIKTLKVLKINKAWLLKIFMRNDLTDVNFQLEEFTVSSLDFVSPIILMDNILEFFKSQNFKKVNLTEWFSFDVHACLFRMSNLKEFSISNLITSYSEHKFPVTSQSIEVLDIKMLTILDDFKNIEAMLATTPNVRHLKLREIDENLAIVIKDKLKKIKIISLVHLHGVDEILRKILPHVEFN